jgi:hypothetical protein
MIFLPLHAKIQEKWRKNGETTGIKPKTRRFIGNSSANCLLMRG